MIGQIWTAEEIEHLKVAYSESDLEDLEIYFNRSRGGIKAKAYQLGLKRKRYRKEVNEAFFKSWSPKMAYVFGLYIGDGTIHYYKKSPNNGVFGFCSTSRKKVEFVRELLESEHVITKMNINFKGYKTTGYNLMISRTAMVRDLEKLGMKERRTYDKERKLPNVKDEYLNHFIRGLFEADGGIIWKCYSKDYRKGKYIEVNFYSTSKNLLEDIIALLRNEVSFSLRTAFPGGCKAITVRVGFVKSFFDYIYKNKDIYYDTEIYNLFWGKLKEIRKNRGHYI